MVAWTGPNTTKGTTTIQPPRVAQPCSYAADAAFVGQRISDVSTHVTRYWAIRGLYRSGLRAVDHSRGRGGEFCEDRDPQGGAGEAHHHRSRPRFLIIRRHRHRGAG